MDSREQGFNGGVSADFLRCAFPAAFQVHFSAQRMSQSEKTGILYDQIIQRVIEDSRERFEAEGADMQVLGELHKVSNPCVHKPPVHCKCTSRFSGLARTLRGDLLR